MHHIPSEGRIIAHKGGSKTGFGLGRLTLVNQLNLFLMMHAPITVEDIRDINKHKVIRGLSNA